MRYILISDGSSDRALIPIINSLLKDVLQTKDIIGERADLARLRKPPKKLEDKIFASIDLYEPEIVFIHRDAERESLKIREREIDKAIENVRKKLSDFELYIKVIPIRMTEAWLLIDQQAVKSAAGNPNSEEIISLPSLGKLESIPNPKCLLETLLSKASGLKGRRLRSLNLRHCIYLVSQYIDDYSILAPLVGYDHLKRQILNLSNN